MADSSTKRIHRVTLTVSSDQATQFSVDSRVPGGRNESSQTYFQVGLVFQLESHALMNKNVALTATSSLRIRRSSTEPGVPASVVFETPPLQNEIQVPDAQAILLGGFVSESDVSSLPAIPAELDNAILAYIHSRSSGLRQAPEVVVLLKPHILKVEMIPVQQPLPTSMKTEEWQPPAVSVDLPVAPAIATLNLSKEPMFRLLPPPPTAFYTLQVGAFGQRANAEALVTKLEQDFDDVFIEATSTGQLLYRVRVGRLTDFPAAEQLQTRLRDRGFSVFMVYPDSR